MRKESADQSGAREIQRLIPKLIRSRHSAVAIQSDFAVLERDLAVLMMLFFIASILLLIAALVAFLRDIYVSLHALDFEVRRARRRS